MNNSLAIVTIVLFCLFLLTFSNYRKNTRRNRLLSSSNNQFVAYAPDKPPKLHILFNDKVLIYRAVQDVRYNKIRILAAVDLSIDKSTIIVKVNGKKVKYKIEVLGLVISFNIQFPLKYVNLVFKNMEVDKLTVNDEEIEYTPVNKIKYKYDFTVCITSIKNNFTAKTMVDQTLNIYKKEGISHAIIYYGDISKEVYEVLDKHVKSGFLEIYYWPQLEILSYIRNFGQILKMNDCLYRSYYNSKYVVNSDIDEIIMPKKFKKLKGLIRYYLMKNPKCGMFNFWTKNFPKNNKTDTISKQDRDAYFKLPPVEDCDLFTKTLGCVETYRGKYIISTQRVKALRFHEAVTTDIQCRVNKEEGHVRHTRATQFHHTYFCSDLKVDNTILNFK